MGSHEMLIEIPHRWHMGACAQLDDDWMLRLAKPCLQPRLLCVRPIWDPLGIVEHQDIWTCQSATLGASGQFAKPLTLRFIDDGRQRRCRPDFLRARPRALKEMDAAVTLMHHILCKACSLELAIDIAGDDRKTVFTVLSQLL